MLVAINKRVHDIIIRRAPYDWQWMFAFLSARAVAGIETFHEDQYTRSFSLDGHRGLITVKPDERSRGSGDAFSWAVTGSRPVRRV